MDIDLNLLEIDVLQSLGSLAEKDLEEALLSGASWEELEDKRSIVTKLRATLYQRLQDSSNGTPADTPFRKEG